MPTKNPRLSFMIPKELLDRVEAFQHEHRIKSTSKAIVQLLNVGMNELEKELGTNSQHSDTSMSSRESAEIAVAFDHADEKSRSMVRLALAEYLPSGTSGSDSANPESCNVHDMTPDEIRAEVERQLAEEAADREKGIDGTSGGGRNASGADCG